MFYTPKVQHGNECWLNFVNRKPVKLIERHFEHRKSNTKHQTQIKPTPHRSDWAVILWTWLFAIKINQTQKFKLCLVYKLWVHLILHFETGIGAQLTFFFRFARPTWFCEAYILDFANSVSLSRTVHLMDAWAEVVLANGTELKLKYWYCRY